MQQEGVKPNDYTGLSLLQPSATALGVDWVRKLAFCVQQAEMLESDVRVGNALVNLYAKSGSVKDACQVFDKMVERDVVTWNTMIGAYAENGDGNAAFQLFLRMQREGIQSLLCAF